MLKGVNANATGVACMSTASGLIGRKGEWGPGIFGGFGGMS